MKRNKICVYNHRILVLAQCLMVGVALLAMSLLFLIQFEQQTEFLDLLNSSITFNIFYVVSMFDAICFFELFNFSKKLKANINIESSLINILLIGIVQIFLLNLFVGIILIYFVYRTSKKNNLNIKKMISNIRIKNEFSIAIFNTIFFILFIIFVYSMVLHRFSVK